MIQNAVAPSLTLRRLSPLSLALVAMLGAPPAAVAGEGVDEDPSGPRITEAELSEIGQSMVVERTRSKGKSAVTFVADAEPIVEGRVMVFQVTSVNASGTTPRWRCVAVDDVAECLGYPVRVPYLAERETVVLTVELQEEPALRAFEHS